MFDLIIQGGDVVTPQGIVLGDVAVAGETIAAITGHGNIGIAGFVAPGTFTLAMVFLVAFVLYYFVNWKYLSTVWPLS